MAFVMPDEALGLAFVPPLPLLPGAARAVPAPTANIATTRAATANNTMMRFNAPYHLTKGEVVCLTTLRNNIDNDNKQRQCQVRGGSPLFTRLPRARILGN
jgi:hypothetical protein